MLSLSLTVFILQTDWIYSKIKKKNHRSWFYNISKNLYYIGKKDVSLHTHTMKTCTVHWYLYNQPFPLIRIILGTPLQTYNTCHLNRSLARFITSIPDVYNTSSSRYDDVDCAYTVDKDSYMYVYRLPIRTVDNYGRLLRRTIIGSCKQTLPGALQNYLKVLCV
jgi:hypothetical protein